MLQAKQVTVSFDLFPNGDEGPVALARFEEVALPDPLFMHVLQRQSCKEPFESRVPDIPQALTALAEIYTQRSTQIQKRLN